jgi:tetratricopeptide (TPR) repeat protein
MSSGLPTIKQTAWISLLIQLLVLGIFIAILYFAGVNEPILFGFIVFLFIVIVLRMLIPRAHRQGIAMYKRRKFAEAIPFFEQSYKFFISHKWVDDFRFLMVFSSSRICCREMALVNIAFCYAQVGNRDKSKEYYHKALTEFPESEIAKTALKLMES